MNWKNYNAERLGIMKDLTERKLVYLDDAIDAVNEYFARIGKLKRWGLTIEEKAIHLDTVDAIKALPTAQPDRKTGKWIKISPADIYECSVCSQNVMTSDIDAYRFCHGCGANMRTAKYGIKIDLCIMDEVESLERNEVIEDGE